MAFGLGDSVADEERCHPHSALAEVQKLGAGEARLVKADVGTVATASTVMPGYLLYNSTKGAVEQMTRVMSKDLGRKGILVNAVAPGPTGTELFFRGKSEEMLKGIANLNPQGRIGTPDEVAEAVVFLAHSSWVSGQVLRANGGMA